MDQEYEEYEAECFQSTRVSGQAGKDAQRLLDRDSGRQLTKAAVATGGGERVELLGVEAGIKLNSRQGEEKKLAREQERGRTER
jgi:hypothetical protein